MYSPLVFVIFALSSSPAFAQTKSSSPPGVPHPALWELYKVYAGVPAMSGPGTSLLFNPDENRIYAEFGGVLWGGSPFNVGNTILTNLSDVFAPTTVRGNFSRIFYLNGSVIITGNVMWWLEVSMNTSSWFERDQSTPWPAGYRFKGIAFGPGGNVTVNNITTLNNGTWVCLRKNSTSPDLENETSSILSSGPEKQLCTDVNSTIVGWTGKYPVIHDVLYAAGMFVAVGRDLNTLLSIVLTSSDGVSWTAVNITNIDTQAKGSSQALTKVRYAGGQFVAVGYQTCCIPGAQNVSEPPPLIVTSPDGLAWTRYQFPQSSVYQYAELTDAAFNGQAWVAVGEATLVGYQGGWRPIYVHTNITEVPFAPPVPPLSNVLYVPSVNLYYATSGDDVYVAKSLPAGHECNVSRDCGGRVLLPPFVNVQACSPSMHICVECMSDSDCPTTFPYCNITGGNVCASESEVDPTHQVSSGTYACPFFFSFFFAVLIY